jgi:hypothetical protein
MGLIGDASTGQSWNILSRMMSTGDAALALTSLSNSRHRKGARSFHKVRILLPTPPSRSFRLFALDPQELLTLHHNNFATVCRTTLVLAVSLM